MCYKSYIIGNFTADFSILVKFGTEFDHVTSDVAYHKRSRSNVKVQDDLT